MIPVLTPRLLEPNLPKLYNVCFCISYFSKGVGNVLSCLRVCLSDVCLSMFVDYNFGRVDIETSFLDRVAHLDHI